MALFDWVTNGISNAKDKAKSEVHEVTSAVGDTKNSFSELIKAELALAKAEIKSSVLNAGLGIAAICLTIFAVTVFLFFLTVAAWWGLGLLVGNALSALIIAAIWLIIAAVLALWAVASFKNVKGMPKTKESIQNFKTKLAAANEAESEADDANDVAKATE